MQYCSICSDVDFRWLSIHGMPKPTDMVASLILNDIQSNAGRFPEKNTFIQKNMKETNIEITRIKITRIRLQKLCAFIKPEIAVGHSPSEGRL